MSTKRDRVRGRAMVAAVTLALLGGCAGTTGGTAAVAPNATLPTTTSTTQSSTQTSRPPRPSPSPTPSSATTETSPTTNTQRPTETNGEPMPSATSRLGVGDCYTVGDDSEVTPVDCAELHQGQVFQTEVDLPGVDPDETDAAKLFDAATGACSAGFETFVGSPLNAENGKFDLAIVLTSASGATTTVACAVVGRDGEQWAGSAENVSGSYTGIDVGDCFDYPTATADALELPCDQPHEAEMYVVDAPLGIDPPDAPYPTADQWQELSVTLCVGPFADYTGQDYESALDLGYTYVYPLEPDWPDVSQRVLSCAITSIDGTRLVGSKRG